MNASGPSHRQVEWDAELEHDLRSILRLAIREDLDRSYDVTTLALVPRESTGRAAMVSRAAGIAAGLRVANLLIDEMAASVDWQPCLEDGQALAPGTFLGVLSGSARDILAMERILLNAIGHLSGIASLTQQYVAQVAETRAVICDTRKTIPGWRRMEKYAVRCGGGTNHRVGLFDAILIKDNHLALGQGCAHDRFDVAAAVARTRTLYAANVEPPIVQIEVDTLDQLEMVLPAAPDIVLLDNMPLEQLKSAVALRDQRNPAVLLEASGGITLDTVRAIALTGVDRISVGAITHSAVQLDVGLDWQQNAVRYP